MRVLITGGAGFLGSAVAKACLERDHAVTILDDFSTGRRDRLHDGLQVFEGTVVDRSALHRRIANVDRVFHFAGSGDRTAPAEAVMRDLAGTELVLEVCALFGRPVLIPSSADVYGGSRGVVRETDPVSLPPPRSGSTCFAAAKLLTERMALTHHQRSNLPVVIARIFDVLGPRRAPIRETVAKLVASAVAGEPIAIPGTGRERRAFLHVDDAAKALVDLMDASSIGRIVNVGGSEEVTLLEVARKIKQLTRSRSPIHRILGVESEEWQLAPRRVACLSRLTSMITLRARTIDRILVEIVRSARACGEEQPPKGSVA